MSDHADTIRFEGKCLVCGEPMSYVHNPADGIIDIYPNEDGTFSMFSRHYATAPPGVNRDCARIFSRLTEVGAR